MNGTTGRMGRWTAGVAMVLGLAAATAWAAQQGNGAVADAVREAELRRFAVTTGGDYDALASLLGDDLVYTHSSASVDSKASYLESLRKGLRYHTIEPRDLKVRVYGTTAIINGEATIVTSTGGGEPNRTELRYTDVWVQRDGRWQMVSWQSTRLP